MSNRTYLSPGVTEIVVKDYANGSAGPAQTFFSLLIPREREVLQLLDEGKSTSEIAEILYIGVKTVETHRWQIMNKLGIRNLAELTKYAIREGLTSLESDFSDPLSFHSLPISTHIGGGSKIIDMN